MKNQLTITWTRETEFGGDLTVTQDLPGEAPIYDMIEAFETFLRAAGYGEQSIRGALGAEE